MRRCLLSLALLGGCANGTDDTSPDVVWEASCSASLVAGETTTDVCEDHSIEMLANAEDADAWDLRVIAGTGSTDCLVRMTLDDVCGAGRYWVGGGAEVDVRLSDCSGPLGAASSGSFSLERFSAEVVEGVVQVDVAGTLSVRVEGESVAVDLDLSATSEVPAVSDFARCATEVDTITGDRASLTPGLDVLFVVHNGASMAEEHTALEAAFPALLASIEGANPDFRIAAISMESTGPFAGIVGEVIDPDTSDPEATFASMIGPAAGTPLPRGRRAVEMALTEPLVTEDNGDFYRSDANLALLFVADVNDTSESNPSFEDFSGLLNGLKSFGPSVQSSAITGPVGGCPTAEAGTSFISLSALSRGTFVSICAGDFGTAFDTLLSPVPTRGTRLASTPVLGSVRVTLDGVELVRGRDWTWEDPYVAVSRELIPETDDFTLEVSSVPMR